MAIGPGKYDEEATLVMERTKAHGVVLVVINGDKGSGLTTKDDFAVLGTLPVMVMLPTILRSIADQIESDMSHA